MSEDRSNGNAWNSTEPFTAQDISDMYRTIYGQVVTVEHIENETSWMQHQAEGAYPQGIKSAAELFRSEPSYEQRLRGEHGGLPATETAYRDTVRHINSRTGRMDGAWAMKQIYDDLGIYRDISWHHRQDDDNVAHNWNSGEDMATIFRKLRDGSGEWDASIKHALDSGALSQERLDNVVSHYSGAGHSINSLGDPLGGIPGEPGPPEGQDGRPYGTDWWGSQQRYTTTQDHPYQHPRTDDVALDLSDQLAFEGMTYAAPGRTGEYEAGQDRGDLHPSLGTDEGAQAAYDLESRFIDELYGTTDRVYDGLDEEATQALANQTLADKIASGEVNDQWGLDLRRVALPEGATETEDQAYERLTRGEVDWAHYQNDNAYNQAYQALINNEEFEGYFDDEEGITSTEEIRLIHQENPEIVRESLIEGQGRDAWRYDWDGRYEPDPAPAPWDPVIATVYKPGTNKTMYNTTVPRSVTPLDTFTENIYEVPRLQIQPPNVPIRIPDNLRTNATPVQGEPIVNVEPTTTIQEE